MAPDHQTLSPAEWQLLCVVYELEAPVGVHNVSEQTDRWSYSTVQTLLRRITEKGWLKKKTAGKRLSLFTPTISFEEAVEIRLRGLLERDFLWNAKVTKQARKAIRNVL